MSLRQHLVLERKPLVFFAPTPTPICTLSTEKGCVWMQGTPLRTGHSRLRPAVTHYYSEIVTSGSRLTLCPGTRLGHVEVPFDLMLQPQRKKFPKEQLVGCSGQGPREADTTCKCNTVGSQGSQPASPQGWCESAPPWPEVASEPQPPGPLMSTSLLHL